MINYLFSQIKKEIGFNDKQKEYILKNIKSNMNIAYIASVPDNYERIKRYTDYFNKIGINFKEIYSIDNRNISDSKNIIKNSDIIFLMGGSPYLQMKFINENDLKDLICSSKIIMGVSAGAMNQGTRVVYKDDFEGNIIKDYEGLGLTDINIFPHYDLENEDIIDETKEVCKIHPILCLPNESFVYIENGNIDIVGQHYNVERKILI